MASDSGEFDLLHRFVTQRDQAAFADIVRQKVNLVYSAALRRVGDRHLAEDITQAVFIILAKKARSIRPSTPLSGWLLKTVQYAAANALKIEARRKRHEKKAGEAMAAAACSSNPTEVLLWQDIAPQLDDAVLQLSSPDRQAILLRFFEGKSTHDLAAALGVSEDAAKQRLSRAVARLRQRLCPDHIGVPAASFTAVLTTFAVQSAPASLASASISLAAAVSTAAVSTGAGFTIAKGALAMMTWTKTKIAAAILAVAALAGTGGVIALSPAVAQDRAAKSEKPAPAEQPPILPTPGGPVDTAPPVIVKTIPESGSAGVDPKLTEIKVTFSKPMQDGNWSFVQTAKETFPKTIGKPKYLPDQRTCILTVQLEPNKPYVIWINRAPYNSFSDPEGRKAVPYLLTFETGK